jgi:hypothetical protein
MTYLSVASERKSVFQNAKDKRIVTFILYACEIWFHSLREHHHELGLQVRSEIIRAVVPLGMAL